MAIGWTDDDAVLDQTQDSVNDEVNRARRNVPCGESLLYCEECGDTASSDAGHSKRTSHKPGDPAITEVGEDQQDEKNIQCSWNRHPFSLQLRPLRLSCRG